MEAHLRFHTFAGKRLHLGVCGSVAAFRTAELVRRWREIGLSVGATLTKAARNFITPLTFESLGAAPIYGDMFSGEAPFEHLEPGQTAHALIIAPASADMLARLAAGRADDMLSAQALAFDGPIVAGHEPADVAKPGHTGQCGHSARSRRVLRGAGKRQNGLQR